MVVDPGEQHRSCRRACRSGVEPRHQDSLCGHLFEHRGRDFTSIGTDVTEPQIIGDDDKKFRALNRSRYLFNDPSADILLFNLKDDGLPLF